MAASDKPSARIFACVYAAIHTSLAADHSFARRGNSLQNSRSFEARKSMCPQTLHAATHLKGRELLLDLCHRFGRTETARNASAVGELVETLGFSASDPDVTGEGSQYPPHLQAPLASQQQNTR
jgi:hypothetical protein